MSQSSLLFIVIIIKCEFLRFVKRKYKVMKWFNNFHNVKHLLITLAAIIAVGSLYVSNSLVSDLKKEELNKMQVWAEAMRSLNNADETTDLNLVLAVLNGNNTIPVVVLDSKGAINTFRNIDIPEKFVESDIADFTSTKRFGLEIRKRMEAIEFKLNFFEHELFEDLDILLKGDEYDEEEDFEEQQSGCCIDLF